MARKHRYKVYHRGKLRGHCFHVSGYSRSFRGRRVRVKPYRRCVKRVRLR